MELTPIQTSQQFPVLDFEACSDNCDERCVPQRNRAKNLSFNTVRPVVIPSKRHLYYETGTLVDIYA
jgi:hypothetical protein